MNTQKNPGEVNTIIKQRAAAQGLSLLALARQAGLPSYYRLICGRVNDAELAAIEAVLGPLEPTHSEITPVPLEVLGPDNPQGIADIQLESPLVEADATFHADSVDTAHVDRLDAYGVKPTGC